MTNQYTVTTDNQGPYTISYKFGPEINNRYLDAALAQGANILRVPLSNELVRVTRGDIFHEIHHSENKQFLRVW